MKNMTMAKTSENDDSIKQPAARITMGLHGSRFKDFKGRRSLV